MSDGMRPHPRLPSSWVIHSARMLGADGSAAWRYLMYRDMAAMSLPLIVLVPLGWSAGASWFALARDRLRLSLIFSRV